MIEHARPMPHGAEPIRVLLVDDQKHVLWGLRKLIEGEWPAMSVAGTESSLEGALSSLRRGRADVVVLDLCLGKESSIERIPELLKASGAPVLVLTGVEKVELHRSALKAGASAVVLKEESAEKLLLEIERIVGRQTGEPRR